MRKHIGLFRGKRKDNGEWVIGYLCRSYYKVEDACICCTATLNFYSVDPTTIGECTGLKDENGKLIFEGDIVLYPWNDQDKPERFTIKFKDGQFVASPAKETEGYWDFIVGGYSNEMQIIGNITDNPELLEGGEGA